MSEAETRLNSTELRVLRRFNTPTIANAIELFNVRPRHTGFLPHYIRCLLPELGAIIGYAVTSRTRAMPPEPGESQVTPTCLATTSAMSPAATAPRSPSARTSTTRPAWEPSSAKSRPRSTRSSAASAILPAAARATWTRSTSWGSRSSGSTPASASAYVRLVDFDTPVVIGGVEIHSGDLIHADKHGVCLIPHSIAHRLAAACAEVERRERPLLDYCTSDEFSLDVYIQLRELSHAQIME